MCPTTDIKDPRLLAINNLSCKLVSSIELRSREFFEFQEEPKERTKKEKRTNMASTLCLEVKEIPLCRPHLQKTFRTLFDFVDVVSFFPSLNEFLVTFLYISMFMIFAVLCYATRALHQHHRGQGPSPAPA